MSEFMPSDSSGGDSSKRPSSTRNAMMREGIMPITSNQFGTPSHKPRTNSLYKASDQMRLTESIAEMRIRSVKRTSTANDSQRWEDNFLDKAEWLSLGDGWHQATSTVSGGTTKCGLHSVVESFGNKLFMAIFEPKTIEGLSACVNSEPSYNLEVGAKIIQLYKKASSSNFQIMFAFKSIADYCLLTCDYDDKRWILSTVKDGVETMTAEAMDYNIRPNLFYNLLIQVRDNSISIDINGYAVFTSIHCNIDGMPLSGLIGVQAKGTKFAIKGWKLRRVDANPLTSSTLNLVSPRRSQLDYSTTQLPTPSTPLANTSSQPKSLADLIRQKSEASSSYIEPQIQRISSEPLVAWGDTGGPGKAKLGDHFTQSPRISATGLNPSTIAPPIRHIRRNTVTGPPISAIQSPSSSSSASGKYQSLIFSDVSYNSTDRTRQQQVSSHSMSDESNSIDNDQSQKYSYNSNGVKQEDMKLTQALSILKEHHDQSTTNAVFRDVVQRDLGVSFDDIAALSTAKRLLNEAVVLPLIMPEFFTGIREPWKGVLLFGPPGTGKTLLAKAVCSCSGSTFFNCSSSSLISKYRGESEKIIRCLFEAARLCAPSIIFLDEVDALVASRGAEGEHEASRRMKTEIFSQMDGIASHSRQASSETDNTTYMNSANVVGFGVMVLATTNCPWDLDEALRRRLEKRIYIPLPEYDARIEIFHICLKSISLDPTIRIHQLAELTNGYSGADIHVVCREASMMPLRRLMADMTPQEMQQRRFLGQLEVPLILFEDFVAAITNTRPSVSPTSIAKFITWEREYGSR